MGAQAFDPAKEADQKSLAKKQKLPSGDCELMLPFEGVRR